MVAGGTIMPIEFDDGSILDIQDLEAAKRQIAARAIIHGQLPRTLDIGGVLVKVENLQVKKQPSIPLIIEDYTEETYEDWTIRVAVMGDGYGVNYFKEGTLRFAFVPGTAAPSRAASQADGVAAAAANVIQEAVTEDEVFIFIKAKIDKEE